MNFAVTITLHEGYGERCRHVTHERALSSHSPINWGFRLLQ